MHQIRQRTQTNTCPYFTCGGLSSEEMKIFTFKHLKEHLAKHNISVLCVYVPCEFSNGTYKHYFVSPYDICEIKKDEINLRNCNNFSECLRLTDFEFKHGFIAEC